MKNYLLDSTEIREKLHEAQHRAMQKKDGGALTVIGLQEAEAIILGMCTAQVERSIERVDRAISTLKIEKLNGYLGGDELTK